MYHKVECPSREIRDAAVEARPGSWGGYSVCADGFRWFIHWIS